MLKEFSERADLHDWFSREDTTPAAVVVKKPNPKNIQNVEKIKELEEHIQRYGRHLQISASCEAPILTCGRLQTERQSLAALLRTPSIPSIKPPASEEAEAGRPSHHKLPATSDSIDSSLLDTSQQSLLEVLREPLFPPQSQHEQSPTSLTRLPDPISSLTSRLSSLSSSLAPTLDSFAAGIHDLELYRSAADTVAGNILRICANRLEERELRASAKSRGIEEPESDAEGAGGGSAVKTELQKEDLKPILAALSRLGSR